MQKEYSTNQWQRLVKLLAPIHDQARLTARRLCRSSDEGDDLFQDTVIRAAQKLPSLRDESRFRGWFYAVLLSLHRTRSRRAFWRRFLPLEGYPKNGLEPIGENGSQWDHERLQAARLSGALAGLPSVQREAVVLFDLEGFSIEEIAVMQKVTHSAVKSRLSRGRERLRRHYERLGFGRKRRPQSEGLEGHDMRVSTTGCSLAVPLGSAAQEAPAGPAVQAALARISKKVNRHG